MEQAFSTVISFVIFIIIGHLLRRFAILKAEAFHVISSLVLYITLPCLIVTSINGVQLNYSLLSLIALGLLCNLLMVAVGYCISRKKGSAAQAFSMLNISGYNIGLFAMPFIYSFLPPIGFLATCLFDAGNAVMCTGGAYALAASVAAPGHRISLKDFLKKICSSVPFCIYIVMISMAFYGYSLPSPILVFTKIAGDANAFLCMIMIGVNINLHMDSACFKLLMKHILVRYAVSAILAVVLYWFLPFQLEIRQAMAVMVLAPTSSIAVIFTMKLKGDVSLAGNINSLTILLSTIIMITMLLYM